MEELWKYHKDENWQYVLSNVVPIEFDKNRGFYEHINKLGIFPDDVCKVIATLSEYMFYNKKENFNVWLNSKQPMLDNNTPIEIVLKPHGLESLKEYLLRYPKI